MAIRVGIAWALVAVFALLTNILHISLLPSTEARPLAIPFPFALPWANPALPAPTGNDSVAASLPDTAAPLPPAAPLADPPAEPTVAPPIGDDSIAAKQDLPGVQKLKRQYGYSSHSTTSDAVATVKVVVAVIGLSGLAVLGLL
ncbi:hypothetical protein HDV00_008763 [Rhizophlyctis rosea]|nr:hypothetical protein HDV00_008763 [Rhizophlyctis rosea]